MIQLEGGERQQVLNPIRIDVEEDATVKYTVEVEGEPVFEGQASGRFSVCVNDVISPYITLPGMPEDNGEVLREVEGFTRDCRVIFDREGTQTVVSFTAFPGGVSGRLFAGLKAGNTDIFRERLLEPSANILMTGRSGNGEVNIPETELYPFYFIFPEAGLTVTDGRWSIQLEGNPGQVYAVDLEAVRRKVFLEEDRLSNVFTLKCGESVSARVAILMETPARERYELLFRNMFGVYEKFSLEGTGTVSPQIEDVEFYGCYEKVTDMFARKRARRKARNMLSVAAGPLGKEKVARALQVLQSDDILLLTQSGAYPVDVEAQEFVWKAGYRGVESLTLEISMARQEEVLDMEDVEIFRDAGIFVEQFDEKFV